MYYSIDLSYHQFQRHLESLFAFLDSVNDAAANCLDHDEGVDGDPDPMVRVGQRSAQPNSLKS